MANTTTSQPPPPSARPVHSKLLRVIAVIILALIVLVGIAVLITWLVIKPKQLAYIIEARSVHNFNLNKDHLNASFDFVLRAHNPNCRVSVYYDSIDMSVAYEDQTIAFNTLEPFYQPRRNVTRLEARLEARDVALSKSLSGDLRLEKASGQVQLEVRVSARIRFKVGVLKLKHRTLRVLCSPVIVHVSSWKSFESTHCDLDF